MEVCCCSSSTSPSTILATTVGRPRNLFSLPVSTAARFSSSNGHARRIQLRRPYSNPLTLTRDPNLSVSFKRRRRALSISAVFERFTERAIKAVVFSQREARALGKDMVFTQHLLLGLVAEDRSKGGFLGTGITIEMAREAVKKIWSHGGDQAEPATGKGGSATDVPFSISSKRVFEAAIEFSRNMGCNFIAPEHIAIGLFTVDDGSAGQVLQR